jgi:hypothetical protein
MRALIEKLNRFLEVPGLGSYALFAVAALLLAALWLSWRQSCSTSCSSSPSF